ncbi:MAG: hypothetical protein RLY57_109 [Candidatus Parcubacteria bacterium]|jgi:glycosyltransferase involved in cell wall biosynthesis
MVDSTLKKKILLINCDWRNLFQNNPHELWEKLERDRLCPDQNDFFIFSWAKQDYVDEYRNWKTVHKKTSMFWFKPWFDLMSWFVIPKVVKAQAVAPEVIVVYDFGFLPTAYRLRKLYGSKIVMVINNMPRLYSAVRSFGWIKSLYSRFLEWRYKHVPDEYFTINDAMKTYLRHLGIPEKHIHMFAMDTINRDMKYIAESKQGVIRSQYGIPANAKVLICVARLEAEKGYDRLLDLFATLEKDCYLIILGEGSLREPLEKQIQKHHMQDRVFMPGFIRRDQIWNYYQDADVFVLLSKVEALGVVVWEAMYMCVPVIGSTAPGIVESTGWNGERGFVLRDDEGEKQFKALLDKCVARDDEQSATRCKMLHAAQAYVEKKITNTLTLNDIV